MLRQSRALTISVAIAGLVAVAGCEVSRNVGGIQGDTRPPDITLVSQPGAGTGTVPDTQQIQGGIRFNLTASDNFGLKRVTVTYTGGYTAIEDSLFASPKATFSVTRTVTFPPTSPVGGLITIIGRALDGANNAASDTLLIYLSNINALQVFLLAPAAGAVASQNLYIPITVQATQNTGVRKIGWQVFPSGLTQQAADSILLPLPFPDTVTFVDSVLVTGATGSFQIVGFAEDSSGRRGATSPVAVTIQSAANDVTPPRVEHFVGVRVEANDTIRVHATDPSGIRSIGFEVFDLAGTRIKADSFDFGAATSTDRTMSFSMALGTIPVAIPGQVQVAGFAWDGAATPNKGVSTVGFVAAGTIERDTITVVFGQTSGLPAGSRIMDMAVDSTRNEIYLTNITRDRLEVFTLTGDSLVAPIPTGSRPWGIALWPNGNNAQYLDTVVVANSGGTNLSIIDVRPVPRREVRRHRLPNFLMQKWQTQLDQGFIKIKVEEWDLSDRPENLALTTFGGQVYAVYSTTPTASQANPFAGRGTVRWENLDTTVANGSHFFWEHASALQNPDATDTMQILVDRPWKPLGDPFQRDTLVCGASGQIVDFDRLGFSDTTFVRNSSNYAIAMIGEGEDVASRFARVLNYQQAAGRLLVIASADLDGDGTIDLGPCPTYIDQGISPAIRVSDFISNTATRVIGIAINWNGLTNLVRTTDSIYVIDFGLRLAGTIQGSGPNPGVDMHRDHIFDAAVGGTPGTSGGGASPDQRLAFAASDQARIDVFDTYFYAPVTSISIRDPIIGPLRLARTASGQVIVGVTARGIVAVRIPAVVNIFPTAWRDALLRSMGPSQ